MSKLKLAIDLDGVVIDTVQSWLNVFHPGHLNEEVYAWDGFDKVGSSVEEFMNELPLLKLENMLMVNNAVETIKELEKKHYIFFLTTKTLDVMEWTIGVLNKYGLGHIPIHNNWLEGMEKEDYGYDYLLDDCPGREKTDRLIMFDQPWNRQERGFKYRVYGWLDFEDLISKL